MKKLLTISLVCGLVALFASLDAFAEPSAKVTSAVGGIAVVQNSAYIAGDPWLPIMKNTVKTSQQKDLFIDVSLETGLTTNTKVTSKLLTRDVSISEANVVVRVLVDGVEALPGNVTFDARKQTLIAEFAGDLRGCLDEYGHVIIDPNGDCVAPEMLALILETMGAHSFNFVAPDVQVGTHTIEVQAKLYYANTQGAEIAGYPETKAYLGKGSVTVESVRMIKDESIVPELQ